MSRDAGDEPDSHEAGQDRWLVSYSDFITLMFAFFAVLYATSQKDLGKAEELQESIKRYLIKAGAFGDSGSRIQQGEKHNQVLEPPISTFRPERTEAATKVDDAEAFIDSRLSKADRSKYVVDLAADEWGVRITLAAESLFASRSDRFREGTIPFLDKLGELLVSSGRKILVEGHVARNETGTARSTWDFASARASNLLRYIQRRRNLPAERLALASFGDSRPLKSGSAQNSRMEIVLLNDDSGW